ncbi:hypothetical protein IWQ56_000402 [Coemansia nantahalensis]|nr:hypothetical protein IWQ56_000402 [Coemansia nantahalensis]
MSSHVPLPKERHSKSKLFVTVSSLGSKRREHARALETHPFNHRLTVVAPAGGVDVRRALERHMGSYFRVQLKLTDLIDPAFIASYVKDKELVALSAGRRIDADDVFAIDGGGRLTLSLTKDTYEVLGLAGRPAAFPLKRGSRFVVEIDLLADHMAPAKKHFQRLQARLDAVLPEPVDFVVALSDAESGRTLNLDIPGAAACPPHVEARTLAGAAVPGVPDEFLAARGQSGEWAECAQDLFEWIGLATAGARALVPGAADPEACTYRAPEPSAVTDLTVCSATGLLSPRAIAAAVAELLAEAQAAGAVFYVAVWGHEDAPVSWAAAEHGFLTSGEHMCAQAYLVPQGHCATFQACGPWDAFS